jgi:hypothetical protein
MENNQQLTELLALDLGVNLINRRPYAKEVFKWQDIDLLPHSSADTLLCEIYEWNGRNWRTTNNNLIGFLFSDEQLKNVKEQLLNVPKHPALILNLPKKVWWNMAWPCLLFLILELTEISTVPKVFLYG